jgi:RNA polymerase sigma-70 factor (ECF subfamily)
MRHKESMLQDRTDERLALCAANGDRQAFGELLERHYSRILSIGWRLLGSRAEAEDLAQDVCVGLSGKVRQFRGEARFTTWLTRVALNAARDALRRRATRGAAHQGFAEVDALRRAGDAARATEVEWLRAALDGLKADLRETAILVLDLEMSHAEAGEALGVSANTVSWRLHEIRKALKARADEDMAK